MNRADKLETKKKDNRWAATWGVVIFQGKKKIKEKQFEFEKEKDFIYYLYENRVLGFVVEETK